MTVLARTHLFLSPAWRCLSFYNRCGIPGTKQFVRCVRYSGLQCVIVSQFAIVHGSQDILFQSIGTTTYFPRFYRACVCSDVASYKKDIRIAKYYRGGDVVMQCHHHGAPGGEVQIVSGALGVPALDYVILLVTLHSQEVGSRSRRC